MLTGACPLLLAFRPLADAVDPSRTPSIPDATRTPTMAPNRERFLITSFRLGGGDKNSERTQSRPVCRGLRCIDGSLVLAGVYVRMVDASRSFAPPALAARKPDGIIP